MGEVNSWRSATDHIKEAVDSATATATSVTRQKGPPGNKPATTAKAPGAGPVEEGEFSIGSFDDSVTLELGGKEVLVAEGYDVNVGVFTQPSAFAITLGHSGAVKELIGLTFPHLLERGPIEGKSFPRKSFTLKVGGIVCQTGFVDAIGVGGQSATIQVRGRDTMQDIHDSYCGVERSFDQKKHVDFVKAVLEHAKFPSDKLQLTDDAMRRAMAKGRPLPFPAVPEEQEIRAPVRMRLGDTVYSFIKRVLDRAGLFLYASPDGQLLITAPNRNSPPLYKLVHVPTEDGKYTHGNCTDFGFEFNVASRVSAYIVYARGGGKRLGVVKHQGGFPDDEMISLGYVRTHTFRDWHVQTDAQAQLMARRMAAEARRKSWQLHVVVAGHTTNALDSRDTLIWRPDTMVRFQSDQLGFDDVFYIEDVRFERNNQGTRTHLRLMRRDDLLFGYEEVDA